MYKSFMLWPVATLRSSTHAWETGHLPSKHFFCFPHMHLYSPNGGLFPNCRNMAELYSAGASFPSQLCHGRSSFLVFSHEAQSLHRINPGIASCFHGPRSSQRLTGWLLKVISLFRATPNTRVYWPPATAKSNADGYLLSLPFTAQLERRFPALGVSRLLSNSGKDLLRLLLWMSGRGRPRLCSINRLRARMSPSTATEFVRVPSDELSSRRLLC